MLSDEIDSDEGSSFDNMQDLHSHLGGSQQEIDQFEKKENKISKFAIDEDDDNDENDLKFFEDDSLDMKHAANFNKPPSSFKS